MGVVGYVAWGIVIKIAEYFFTFPLLLFPASLWRLYRHSSPIL